MEVNYETMNYSNYTKILNNSRNKHTIPSWRDCGRWRRCRWWSWCLCRLEDWKEKIILFYGWTKTNSIATIWSSQYLLPTCMLPHRDWRSLKVRGLNIDSSIVFCVWWEASKTVACFWPTYCDFLSSGTCQRKPNRKKIRTHYFPSNVCIHKCEMKKLLERRLEPMGQHPYSCPTTVFLDQNCVVIMNPGAHWKVQLQCALQWNQATGRCRPTWQ